jgi:hypothetical protein
MLLRPLSSEASLEIITLAAEELSAVEALSEKLSAGLALLLIKNEGGFADRLVRDSRTVSAERLQTVEGTLS